MNSDFLSELTKEISDLKQELETGDIEFTRVVVERRASVAERLAMEIIKRAFQEIQNNINQDDFEKDSDVLSGRDSLIDDSLFTDIPADNTSTNDGSLNCDASTILSPVEHEYRSLEFNALNPKTDAGILELLNDDASSVDSDDSLDDMDFKDYSVPHFVEQKDSIGVHSNGTPLILMDMLPFSPYLLILFVIVSFRSTIADILMILYDASIQIVFTLVVCMAFQYFVSRQAIEIVMKDD